MAVLTRPLPDNPILEAMANPLLRTTAGDVVSQGFGSLGRRALDVLNVRARGLQFEESVGPGGVLETRAVPKATVPAEELNKQYPYVKFDRPMAPEAAKLLADVKRQEMIREDIVARHEGILAPLAGAALSMITDPLEIASMFIPVVGPAQKAWLVGRLGRVGGRVAEGVIEGGVGNLITEPAYFGLSKSLKLDYDMSDALMNVGLGAVFGGVIGTGIGAVERVRGRRAAWIAAIEPTRQIDAPTARQIEPLTALDIDPRQHMSPPEREAALRTSVAQTLHGQPVRVALPKPNLASEPDVPEGFVRMYYGTDKPAVSGERQFSSNRTFARDQQNTGEAGLWFVDVPRNDPMFVAKRGKKGLDAGYAVTRKFDPAQYGGAKRVADVAVARADEQPKSQAHMNRRAAIRQQLGLPPGGEQDHVIDEVIKRMNAGQPPREALRSVLGYSPGERAAPRPETLSLPPVERTELEKISEEESDMLAAQIADAQNRGLLSPQQVAALEEMKVVNQKAAATDDVLKAAAACIIQAG